jgi:glycosyltransferase involved in cell wall biosynthesis
LKVHHLSSAHFVGGAARAGYRIHRGLIVAGYNSLWMDAGRETPALPNLRQVAVQRPRWKGFARLLGIDERKRFRRAFRGAGTLATIPSGAGRSKLIVGGDWPDIFHFHWVADFLDWSEALPVLTARVPLVWTLHDLNPLAGAWHYDPGSEERSSQRDRWNEKLARRKRELLMRLTPDRLAFIAPSRWIAERARASEITAQFPIHHVPYGLDTEQFRPGLKAEMRARLGLPVQGLLVGFVADSLVDRRKGAAQLCDALALLGSAANVALVTVGRGDLKLGGRYYPLGPIQDDDQLRIFYAACDLFVCPSLQDNLPNTVLEAMACGTPVAAFAAGGIPDMVEDSVTGKLAPPGEVPALARIIRELLSNAEMRGHLGRNARLRVEAEFALPVVIRRHGDLYRSMRATPMQP